MPPEITSDDSPQSSSPLFSFLETHLSQPVGRVLSRFGAGLQSASPPLDDISARLAMAAGNNGPAEMLMQKRALDQRGAMEQSELQNQQLQREHLKEEMSAFETPAQQDTRALNRLRAELTARRQMAEPEIFSEPSADGKTLNYFQRKYDAGSDSYIITPTEVQSQEIVSSPANPQVPYRPDATVLQSRRSQLTTGNPKYLESQMEFNRQKSLATDPDIMAGKLKLATAEGAARANQEATISRGSNAALANVPPHLIPAATADATKAATEYATSKAVSDRMASIMGAARNGNVLSYQVQVRTQLSSSAGTMRNSSSNRELPILNLEAK